MRIAYADEYELSLKELDDAQLADLEPALVAFVEVCDAWDPTAYTGDHTMRDEFPAELGVHPVGAARTGAWAFAWGSGAPGNDPRVVFLWDPPRGKASRVVLVKAVLTHVEAYGS